ncbi:hypothetical protein QNI19_29525 [Cytophagaceae bacterium DM2B3-1]|uniref:Lipoprotein n=1 Tax=Xanthocytophaga flava TaxID=3048013 RepID=A0ABT7CTL2_9BACT|nr:hypothetical protein [Xanthocytophaga flavus]MDJ1471862.1 hypothetical protein [Xanthocytophaga flavus]MDJ1497115.1 hypothetical protein [Xanthocytophaga flavus]
MSYKCKLVFSKAFLALLYLMLGSCAESKHDFYKDQMEGFDVWRLPIVKPYRLLTADCFSKVRCIGWSFQSRDFLETFTVDSVNYDNNYILFYTPYNRENYVAIDVIIKKVYKFTNAKAYKVFLKENKIDDELYSVHYVHASWKATTELPWKGELLEY